MRLGWVCRRVAPFGAVLIATFAAFALLLRWGLLCTNIHTLQHINRLCTNHLTGEAIGNLCEPLCLGDALESLSCHPSNQQEGTVFSAIWKGKRILFKTPKRTSLFESELVHWIDNNNIKQYPTDDQFIAMIQKLVQSKINITISVEEAMELSKLPGEKRPVKKKLQAEHRMVEMDNTWLLLQDNEYLHTVLFSKNNVFPKSVGTCGSLYAIEYAEIAKGSSALFSLEDSEDEWERRTYLGGLILELLKKVDNAHLQLCDIQLNNFGSVDGRLYYLTPDNIRRRGNMPRTVPCKKDNDCGYLDCRALCNLQTGHCNSSIESNNLQMVCEKIYLGWTASGRVILPGLLVSTKASSNLAALIRRCADPQSISHLETIERALYNTLMRTI